MSWTITLGGVDRSSVTLGCEITEELYGADQCYVTINNADGTYDSTFKHGDDMQITVDATIKFIGSVERIELVPTDGVVQLYGREKLGEFMEIFPIESVYTTTLRSDILIDLVYTKAYGREVNTYYVSASPTSTEITIEFKGSKSLFEILDDFSLEDNYEYFIKRRTDSGDLNGNAGAYGSGVTVLTFDGTTNSYSADELNKGILTFTSGTLDGDSFKITDSTSTTITVSGDASSGADDDTFDLQIDALYYRPKQTVLSALTLSTTTDEIWDFRLPQAGQDIKNRVHVIGNQKLGGGINALAAYEAGTDTTVITVDDADGTYETDAFIGGFFTFVDTAGIARDAYVIADNGDDGSNDTFTVYGDPATAEYDATYNYSLPILFTGNDSTSQAYKGNTGNTPDTTNVLVKADQINDETISTPKLAQQRARQFLTQRAWKLDIYTVLAYAQDYDTLNTGEVITTTLDSYVSARDMIVSGLKYSYPEDACEIRLTYYQKELENLIAELIRRDRQHTQRAIETSTVALKAVATFDELVAEEAVDVLYRTIDDNAFVIGRNIIGNNKVFNSTLAGYHLDPTGMTSTSGTYTFCWWQYRTNTGYVFDAETGRLVICNGLNAPTNNVLSFYDGTWRSFTNATTTANTWEHCMIVFNSGTSQAEAFIDNVSKGTLSYTSKNIDDNVAIGTERNHSATFGYTGYLYDFRIYEVALSNLERTSVYNGEKDVQRSSCILLYDQKEDGTNVYDESPAHNNATIGGGGNFIGDNLTGTTVEKIVGYIGDYTGSTVWDQYAGYPI